MPPEKRSRIASLGDRAAHAQGTAHRFTTGRPSSPAKKAAAPATGNARPHSRALKGLIEPPRKNVAHMTRQKAAPG
jgi:hypothetical protein